MFLGVDVWDYSHMTAFLQHTRQFSPLSKLGLAQSMDGSWEFE